MKRRDEDGKTEPIDKTGRAWYHERDDPFRGEIRSDGPRHIAQRRHGLLFEDLTPLEIPRKSRAFGRF